MKWCEKETYCQYLSSKRRKRVTGGFTLVELSIVLVIIGLIIGGILVGQDLIRDAETQAQISQIQKYNVAVNTFFTKYNGLPGDLRYTDASNFGFVLGTNCVGEQGGRDGNGLIDGLYTGYVLYQGEGETALFWSDLSSAGFIDGNFNANSIVCGLGGSAVMMSSALLANYFPAARAC